MTHAEQVRQFVEMCRASMPTSMLDVYESHLANLLAIADELEA